MATPTAAPVAAMPTPTPTPTPTRKASTEGQGESGETTAATTAAGLAELDLSAPLDTNFDSDSDSSEVAAAVPEAVGGGPKSESPPGRNEPPILAAKAGTGLDSCSPEAVESIPATTAADVDFDSDSPPGRTEAVVTAPPAFTAADIDFDDSDSSAATPVPIAAEVCASADPSSPRGAADSICADFDVDPQAPTTGGGDEVRRLASDLHDWRGGPSGTGRPVEYGGSPQKKLGSESSRRGPQHDDEEERYPTAPVGTVEGPTSAWQGNKSCGGGVVAAAHKRKRCGTVYLGGVAADRGFCASSLSQR